MFDAGGVVLNIGEWGGGWEEFVRANLTNQFEKEFNCKINWDSSFPWFPKFATSGARNPVFDICNWNLPNLTQTKQAGDYFLNVDEILANVPNANKCWDFAFSMGLVSPGPISLTCMLTVRIMPTNPLLFVHFGIPKYETGEAPIMLPMVYTTAGFMAWRRWE